MGNFGTSGPIHGIEGLGKEYAHSLEVFSGIHLGNISQYNIVMALICSCI